MSGLLSWDTLDDAENQNALSKAKESLKNLDTSAGEQELKEIGDHHAKKKMFVKIGAVTSANVEDQTTKKIVNSSLSGSPAKSSVPPAPLSIDYDKANDIMRRAHEAVQAQILDLEGEGGRVAVDDKFLINSRADLNQLIPFKYNWAWSMYLDSCEKHWMPGEMEVNRILPSYNNMPVTQKKLIWRLLANYMYSGYIYTGPMLVSLYKHITNPECRQYILRQCFEEQAFHHAMHTMVELFDVNTPELLELKADEKTFKLRHERVAPFICPLADMNLSTDGEDNIGTFLVALSTIYGGMKLMVNFVPLFQLWKLAKTDKLLAPLGKQIEAILRDLGRQYEFGSRLINGIIEENPLAFNENVKARIYSMMYQLHETNVALLTTLHEDNGDIAEGTYCSQHFMNHFLSNIGISSDRVLVNPTFDPFIDYFFSLNGHVDHNQQTSLSGSNNHSSNGSLAWD